MDLSERHSTNVSDVHPVKTVCICRENNRGSPSAALPAWTPALMLRCGLTLSLQVCLWTRFHFIFLPLWQVFLLPCAVREAVIFHTDFFFPSLKLVFIQTAPFTLSSDFWSHSWHSLCLPGIFFCVCMFFFFQHGGISMRSSGCIISEKIWRVCYQASTPASPFKTQFYLLPLYPSLSSRCVIWGSPCLYVWVTGSTLFNPSLSYSIIRGHEGVQSILSFS